jgi:hypothetical protein
MPVPHPWSHQNKQTTPTIKQAIKQQQTNKQRKKQTSNKQIDAILM